LIADYIFHVKLTSIYHAKFYFGGYVIKNIEYLLLKHIVSMIYIVG